nr:nucleoredoxin-like protein 2 isoform X2 [Caretta caretta]
MVDVFSGRPLLTRDGHAVDPEEVLQNKIVGLYFSAGWCSPCRDFTPVLCDFYSELLEGARPPAPFEIVFVSSDRSPEEMAEYMHDMHGDWLALPFHDPYKQ